MNVFLLICVVLLELIQGTDASLLNTLVRWNAGNTSQTSWIGGVSYYYYTDLDSAVDITVYGRKSVFCEYIVQDIDENNSSTPYKFNYYCDGIGARCCGLECCTAFWPLLKTAILAIVVVFIAYFIYIGVQKCIRKWRS